jgi:hypothetical protein
MVSYSLTESGKKYIGDMPKDFPDILNPEFIRAVDETIQEVLLEENPYHKYHKAPLPNPT